MQYLNTRGLQIFTILPQFLFILPLGDRQITIIQHQFTEIQHRQTHISSLLELTGALNSEF